MSGYGNIIGDVLIAALLVGVAVGAALIVGGWAAWHFLLSHIHLVWR